jgi:hypothetical protein
MDITGNWRETMQITDKHNVTYLRIDYNPQAAGDYEKTTIVVAILLVVSILLTAGLSFLAWKFNKQLAAKGNSVAPEGGSLISEEEEAG